MVVKSRGDLLTVREVAEMVGHDSPHNVYRWINEGRIPAKDVRPLGSRKARYMIRRVDVEKLIGSLAAGN